MYRNTWMVMVLALVVSIVVVPAVKAGSVVVEQRIAPSVSADYTIRDPRTLRPRPYLTQMPSGELQVLPPQDWMTFPRDGILVVSLGGLAGDRNLVNFIPRLDLRVVECKIDSAAQGRDQEAWLRFAVNEARTLYARSRREMDECAHFAPFYACDKGQLVLVIDLSTLLLGAHSVDFTVRQEGRHGALPAVAGRAFYLAEPMPVEVPNPEIYGAAPPQVVPAPPACRPAAPAQQGEANVNASAGTPKVHRDKFEPSPPQQLTGGQLEGPAQVFATAAAAAQGARAAAPTGTTEFPLATTIVTAYQGSLEAALTPEARKSLQWWANNKGYMGKLTQTAFFSSANGMTRFMVFYLKPDGSLLNHPITFRLEGESDMRTSNPMSPDIPAGVVSTVAAGDKPLVGGELIHIRALDGSRDVRLIRLTAGMTAWVPIILDAEGRETGDLRIIAKGGE